MEEENNCVGIAIDHTGWWIKYKEFAQSMGLEHEVFEIERSDWLDRTRRYACVLWRPNLDPPYCDEAREKIYFLEKFERKRVFPNWSTFWHYDNKRAQAYLFQTWGVPSPPTFVSYSEPEAREFAARTRYPLVSKSATGASSDEVHLLRDRREALREIRRVFARPLAIRALRRLGVTLRPSLKSGNSYVLWQEFVADNSGDLRITVIGGKYGFAFARNNRPGDFRASGSGLIEYGVTSPTEEMKYCIALCRQHEFDSMAFDIVCRGDQFLVLEMSYAFRDDPVYDTPGHYLMSGSGELSYEPGHVWPQEIIVRLAAEYVKAARGTPANLRGQPDVDRNSVCTVQLR